MDGIKDKAEVTVREYLKKVGKQTGGEPLRFSDFMNDGTDSSGD
jgi:5-oxoprolinase (ATP-hydrolysing)